MNDFNCMRNGSAPPSRLLCAFRRIFLFFGGFFGIVYRAGNAFQMHSDAISVAVCAQIDDGIFAVDFETTPI